MSTAPSNLKIKIQQSDGSEVEVDIDPNQLHAINLQASQQVQNQMASMMAKQATIAPPISPPISPPPAPPAAANTQPPADLTVELPNGPKTFTNMDQVEALLGTLDPESEEFEAAAGGIIAQLNALGVDPSAFTAQQPILAQLATHAQTSTALAAPLPPVATAAEALDGISQDLDTFERSEGESGLNTLYDEVTGGGKGKRKKKLRMSPTAIRIDDWYKRRGREILADNEKLRATVGKGKEAELIAADFFASAFSPEPELVDTDLCSDKLRREFMGTLLDTAEYRALHAQTQLDDLASEIAATSFSKQFIEVRVAEATANPTKGSSDIDGMMHEMRMVGGVCNAIKQAQQDVQDAKDMQGAFGMGKDASGAWNRMDPSKVAAAFKKVRKDPKLRRISELAGRYRRMAQARQRRKMNHGLDDVVGVVNGGDLARLLPSELSLLCDEDVELYGMMKLIERSALCRDHRRWEKEAKGPIIVFLDESGSMAGEPEYNAKAFALALAYIARHQRRWCCFCSFASAGDGLRKLVLPPGQWEPEKLIEWLSLFINGGTDLNFLYPKNLEELYTETGAERGKTDLILVTDACVDVPRKLEDSFLEWKHDNRAKLISLIIGHEPGELKKISDEVHTMRALDVENEGVGQALSI